MRRKMGEHAMRVYDRVLLACYWLSDAEGSYTQASNGEIAYEAKCKFAAVSWCLREMENRDAIIRVPAHKHPSGIRTIYLVDGPECQKWGTDEVHEQMRVMEGTEAMENAAAPEVCVEIGFDECADSRLTDAEFRLVTLLRVYGEAGFTFADMVRDCSWVYKASKVQRLRISLRNLENFGYIHRMSADSDRFVACVLSFSKQGA